jgi:hypothetical protein
MIVVSNNLAKCLLSLGKTEVLLNIKIQKMKNEKLGRGGAILRTKTTYQSISPCMTVA